MLVKYRTLPSITAQNFLDDIVGILDGSITSTASISAGADTLNLIWYMMPGLNSVLKPMEELNQF